ncbi:phospholipase A and acyltransferase 5 isoform X2 [Cavia porcellus]|uniref:phospholipase A and acyltransferase 5 isoform X2 n=1 Tax=Cavia porcellus TaxID=10141 RepID=UPI002FE2A91C
MGLSSVARRKPAPLQPETSCPPCPSRKPSVCPPLSSETLGSGAARKLTRQRACEHRPGSTPGTPNKKRAQLDVAPQPSNEGRLIRPATEGKSRPRPGDLIEIFRVGYEHWAIYVEDDCVVHLAPPSEDFEVGSITSVFSNRALVKYSRLEDVLHGCSWTVNNKLDGTYLPLPVDRIIQRTKKMINKIVQYSLIEGNCEHFVNNLRYGVSRSQQVWPLSFCGSLWCLLGLCHLLSHQKSHHSSYHIACCTRRLYAPTGLCGSGGIYPTIYPWRSRKSIDLMGSLPC